MNRSTAAPTGEVDAEAERIRGASAAQPDEAGVAATAPTAGDSAMRRDARGRRPPVIVGVECASTFGNVGEWIRTGCTVFSRREVLVGSNVASAHIQWNGNSSTNTNGRQRQMAHHGVVGESQEGAGARPARLRVLASRPIPLPLALR